jgi:hypothetical protein
LTTNGVSDDDLNSNVPRTVVQPSISPAFTGTLDLTLFRGVGPTARRLLGLPNGLHFRKLALRWIHEGDLQWMIALVVGCSDTLQCLSVTRHLHGSSSCFCA